MMKSACGIEAVYMCFNGTGIWGGETIWVVHCIFCVKVMPGCLCCFTFFSLLLFKIKDSSWRGCFLRENIIAIVFGMLIIIFH